MQPLRLVGIAMTHPKPPIPGLDLKFAYAGVRLESAVLFLLAD